MSENERHAHPVVYLAALVIVVLLVVLGPSTIFPALGWTGALLLGVPVAAATMLLGPPLWKRATAPPKEEAEPVREEQQDVAVGHYENYTEAGLAAGMLRAAGIRCVLIPLSGTYPYAAQSSPYELRVLEEHLDQAEAVLAAGVPHRTAHRLRGPVRRQVRRRTDT